jgi:hypothetical protein
MRRTVLLWFLFIVLTTSSTAEAFQAEATPTPQQPPSGPELLFDVQTDDGLGYFRVEAAPGDQVDLSVQIGNSGVDPATFRTYAADAFTMENGGFGLNDSTMPTSGPTTWLDYPTEEMSFQPGTALDRTFTVAVPQGTSPGQYITGIALETVDATPLGNQEGVINFSVVKRSARAVFIVVPGPIKPGMMLTNPSINQDSANSLRIDLRNTGNVLLNPTGTVRIVADRGTTLVDAPVQMGTVYAGHSTVLAINLPQPLPAGDYLVSAALRDEATGATAELPETPFTIEAATTAEPVSFVSATVTPRPSADEVQLAEVTAVIGNTAEPIANLQVTLHVFRDGELLESFPIATSVTLPFGETTVQNRYLPLDGWSPGSWTFSLTLEQIDPATGTSQQLGSFEVPGAIDIA